MNNAAAATTEQDRVPALDGVRGLAILIVMQFHFYGLLFNLSGQRTTTFLDRAASKIFGVGWVGVDLFFVLSGFLITGILLDTKSRDGYFRAFFARRVLRIVPLFYGFLAVVMFVLPHAGWLAGPAQSETLSDHQIWYWTFTFNIWSSIEALDPFVALVHVPLWSIAVEQQFYLAWPFVVLLLPRRSLMAICICLIIAAPFARWLLASTIPDPDQPWALGYAGLLPARMDSLAIGALIAAAIRSEPDFARLRSLALPAAGAAAFVLATIALLRDEFSPFDTLTFALGLSAFVALFGALLIACIAAPESSWLQTVIAHPALRAAGRYSYAMYIFHLLVAFALLDRVLAFQADHDVSLVRTIGGSQIPVNIAFSAAATAITVVLAYASWHLYEKRFLQLKSHFRTSPRAAPRPASSSVDALLNARREGAP